MAITKKQRYTNPTTGVQAEANVAISVDAVRLDATEGPEETPVLKATSTGGIVVYRDITDLVTEILDGSPGKALEGRPTAYFDRAYANNTSLVIAAAEYVRLGSPSYGAILLATKDHDGTDSSVALVASVSGGDPKTLTLGAIDDGGASYNGFWNDYDIGDILQLVYDPGAATPIKFDIESSLNVENEYGVKALLEAPDAPTFAVAQWAGDEVAVTIYEGTEVVVTHYDVYARDQSFTELPVNAQADEADVAVTDFMSGQRTVYLSTHGGGTDAGGGSLVSAEEYFLTVVAKTGTGEWGNVESKPATPTSIVLD